MIQFDEHMFQMGWFNHQLVKDLKQIALINHGIFCPIRFLWTDAAPDAAGGDSFVR